MPANKSRPPQRPPASSTGSAEPIKLLSPLKWERTYTLEELPCPMTDYLNYVPNIVLRFRSVLDGDEFGLLMYVVRWTYGGKKSKRQAEDEDLPTKGRPVYVEANARTLGDFINRSADVARDRLRTLHDKGILCVGYQAAPNGDGYAGFSIGLGPVLVKAIEKGILPHKLIAAAAESRQVIVQRRRLGAKNAADRKRAKATQHRRDRLSSEID